MMEKQFMNEAVRIFFKNGIQKYGFLLDALEHVNFTLNAEVNFLPNSSLNEYLQNPSDSLVERINKNTISAIDPFVK